jgi:hypothetical protein
MVKEQAIKDPQIDAILKKGENRRVFGITAFTHLLNPKIQGTYPSIVISTRSVGVPCSQ